MLNIDRLFTIIKKNYYGTLPYSDRQKFMVYIHKVYTKEK